MNLVILGPPGVGKGTQAEQLSVAFELPHIATGDLFRENFENQTPLGLKAKAFMERGELVPDDLTEQMVEERLSRPDARSRCILDGFPRDIHQAKALTALLERAGRRVSAVLYIHGSEEAIVRRLSGRIICLNCHASYHIEFKPPARPGVCDSCGGPLYKRDDDNPETIRARLRAFHAETEPLIDYYRAAGLLIEVDGQGEVSEVSRRVVEAGEAIRSGAIETTASG